MERYIFQPPGRLGGLPAATGYTRRNGAHDIGKIDVLELRPGDRLRIGTQGGGGLGDPLLRLVEAVVEDVANGLVSVSRSAAEYGVMFASDGSVDLAATKTTRRERLALRPAAPPTFTFGPARDAYRQQWPLLLEDALAQAISGQPPVLRQFLHHELKRLLTERMQAGERVAPELLPALVGEVAERLSAGYPAPLKGN